MSSVPVKESRAKEKQKNSILLLTKIIDEFCVQVGRPLYYRYYYYNDVITTAAGAAASNADVIVVAATAVSTVRILFFPTDR